MNKRPLIACATATSLMFSGCASMNNKQQSAAVGAGTGALVGALVGGLLGGGKWAAIGAASGAALGGLAGYALAPDPLTQSVAQTADDWKQTMSAQTEVTRTTPVRMQNGQQVNQIDEQRMAVPSQMMVSNGKISPAAESKIRTKVSELQAQGGSVQITYPASAPKSVVQSLLDTGATVQKSERGDPDYVFTIRRRSAFKQA